MRERRMTTARQGCATCTSRKRLGSVNDARTPLTEPGRAITCDRARPDCANCSGSNRKCRGYSLRLSWPRANDHRRAVVKSPSPYPSPPPRAGQISNARFVHMSHWDIELYNSFNRAVPAYSLSFLDVPTIWNPSELEVLDHDLFEYFCCVASTSLAPFGHDTIAIGNVLARISLKGEAASAVAVLQALLAFSSLHRYGLQSQALELKIAAIGSLAKGSLVQSLHEEATIQHIAAGMLLCSFEVHQSSCTSGQWTGYLGGVKAVIKESSIESLLRFDADVALLLDWVYYHDVLARFSLLYWNKEGAPELPLTPTGVFCSQISHLPPPIFSILDLLSQVCETVSRSVTASETNDSIDDYKNFLEVMDWRIRSLSIQGLTYGINVASDEMVLLVQLYQLALLVYLNRSSDGLIDQPLRTQRQIDKAFIIISQLRSCVRQFPILVIGCEARTDEQRAVILDAISRTENLSSSRSFNYCKRLLEAVWAQDDLTYGENISYGDKLASVMNLCINAPTFI